MNQPFSEAVCWTLLHSLWQGLAVSALLTIVLQIVPTRHSSTRYVLSIGAFLLFFAGCLFTLLFNLIDPVSHSLTSVVPASAADYAGDSFIKLMTWNTADRWNEFQRLVVQHQQWIFFGWLTGAFAFGLRYAGGLLFIQQLKRNAWPVSPPWNEMVQEAAAKLGISRMVKLAESARIHVPTVVGFLKPVVLIPVGMLANLSASQVEAILMHELSHVRRHDFIINLIQSAIEVVFFFNPFVWWISSTIRKEREHCCDDEVVVRLQNPILYVRTLAWLAEHQTRGFALAPALGHNKNELLNRISRIMEKSAKNQMGKEKFFPLLALVIAGLACASWITFKKPVPDAAEAAVVSFIQPDTLVKEKNKKEKSASYSRKSITVYDEQGKPHEELTEEFEGDEELRALMAIPASPAIAGWYQFNPPSLSFPSPQVWVLPDTMPGFRNWNGNHEWEAFGKAFEKEFKSKFGDFYEDHEAEFEKMMKDLEHQFDNQHWSEQFDESLMLKQEEMQKMMKSLQELDQSKFMDQMAGREDEFRKMADNLSKMGSLQELALRDLQVLQNGELRKMEEDLRRQEANMKLFDREMTDQLRIDGYLGKDEKLETLEWNDGNIKVNGKELKEADKARYRELHRKYFNSSPRFQYPE